MSAGMVGVGLFLRYFKMWDVIRNILWILLVVALFTFLNFLENPDETAAEVNKVVNAASGVYHNFINNFSNGRGGAGSF